MRKEQRDPEPRVWFNDRFDTSDAEEHRAQMFAAPDSPANRFASPHGGAEAGRGDALPIRATSQAESAYLPWVRLKEIGSGPPFNGLLEKRSGALKLIATAPCSQPARAPISIPHCRG
ncbi:MAG: hypothetical protein RML45_16225 [Acetobacteraceae bacterium]|nr:hypothetical protein [Acetobacteraceae bacterium]